MVTIGKYDTPLPTESKEGDFIDSITHTKQYGRKAIVCVIGNTSIIFRPESIKPTTKKPDQYKKTACWFCQSEPESAEFMYNFIVYGKLPQYMNTPISIISESRRGLRSICESCYRQLYTGLKESGKLLANTI